MTETALNPLEHVGMLEIHLSWVENFTRRFGKRIKEAGGRYSHCRGGNTKRYVHIPLTHPELIEEVLDATNPRWDTVVIIRDLSDDLRKALDCGGHVQAWASVYTFKFGTGKDSRPLARLTIAIERNIQDCTKRRAK